MSFNDAEWGFSLPLMIDADPADQLPTPTADALAALLGPCKDLIKLTLPSHEPGLWGCGRTAGGYAPWVDEAFAGHVHLATLRIPIGDSVMPALPRILGHLPGLVDFDLHVSSSSGHVDSSGALMAALGRCCPRLEGLHLSADVRWEGFDPTPLSQSPQIKRLTLPWTTAGSFPQLDLFLGSLPRLEQLRLGQFSPALVQVAPQLTHLTLPTCRLDDLPELGLGRLEAFESPGPGTGCLPAVLSASRHTLRSLAVQPDSDPRPLFGLLDSCPGLTHLDLRVTEVDLADIPQGLLNRLEWLRLAPDDTVTPIHLVSATLRELYLHGAYSGPSMTLACPTLEYLALPTAPAEAPHPYALALGCPRLRLISGLGEQALAECQDMACLTRVDYTWSRLTPHPPPAALAALLARAPRLACLSGVRCAQPQDLTDLCRAAPSLHTLHATLAQEGILTTPGDESRLDLTLPGHVESLGLTLELIGVVRAAHTLDVGLEAAGLRVCSLGETSFQSPIRSLAIRCPALAALQLSLSLCSFDIAPVDITPVDIAPVDIAPVGIAPVGIAPAHTPTGALAASVGSLRRLEISDCPALEPAVLLACLQQHARLRQVVLGRGTLSQAHGAWPQLADALCALPRLTQLALEDVPAARLVLACPALRDLRLSVKSLRSLVLDCPLLEELRGPLGPDLERFELTGGEAVYLRRVGVMSHEWAKRLAGRWPGVELDESPWEV
ncbi:hypothetical protein PAPYR_1666 [Paratrimastix pyriformis]|uniref:Uncharacterized protein n=1 Tax=Paratrimastix pyriformis TaxID=342808 RepID=A0ABQ8UTV1_9EUKA|nr:hypothetical protein PAPYR_1666 [Paratrimastix pyriformis]